jgi:3-oxoacyl-(acyl-carrier-protein) synthase
VTPEATRAVIERDVPGLAELMRAEGVRKARTAALSRAVVGVRKRKVIVNKEDNTQLKGIDPFQIGIILGVGVESMELMEHNCERFLSRGPRGISPFALPNIYLSSITSHVTQYFTIRGTSYAVSTACASATHAMINSFLQIQGGGEGGQADSRKEGAYARPAHRRTPAGPRHGAYDDG